MMRRAIAVASVAAVATALLLPWLFGLRAAQLYASAVDALAASGYRIIQREYQRGWFQSELLLLFAPPASGASAPARLQVAGRMSHGPRGDALLRWPPVLAVAHARVTVLGGPRRLPPLLIDAPIAFGGTMAAELRLPDITYSGNAGNLHLVDVRGRLHLADDRVGWSGQGELPLLEAVDRAGRALVLDGLGWRFALRNLVAGVPVGEVALSVRASRLEAPAEQSRLTLAGLSLNLETAVDAGRAGLAATLSLDRFTLNHAAYAPLRLRLEATGFDAPALAALLDAWRRLAVRNLPESVRGFALGALLTESLPGLLSSGPHLRLERLELATPSGLVTADAQLTLSDGSDPATDWLQRLSGEARASAPQALMLQLLVDAQRRRVQRELRNRGEPADPLPAQLAEEVEAAAQTALMSLLREGWLTADRGRLSAVAVLRDGRLTLNGNPLPIGGWTGP